MLFQPQEAKLVCLSAGVEEQHMDVWIWALGKCQNSKHWQGGELELPQDENGRFISEGNLNSGINLALCIHVFIYPEFSEFELGSLLFHLHLAREEQEM